MVDQAVDLGVKGLNIINTNRLHNCDEIKIMIKNFSGYLDMILFLLFAFLSVFEDFFKSDFVQPEVLSYYKKHVFAFIAFFKKRQKTVHRKYTTQIACSCIVSCENKTTKSDSLCLVCCCLDLLCDLNKCVSCSDVIVTMAWLR